MRPRLALVPGEPAGIGPELCVRLVQQPHPECGLIAFADPDTLQAAAEALALPLRLLPPDATPHQPGDLPLLPVHNRVPALFGAPDPRNAGSVIAALHAAAQACIEGTLAGLVTGPVHKATINAGGIAYSGTTELLAEQAGCDVVMMLANDIVRVALATTHLPLRAVADAITPASLHRTLRILHAALRDDFGIDRPCHRRARPEPARGRSRASRLTRRSRSSSRCSTCCAARACRWSARCRPTPHSCQRSCKGSTRCWRCITTRACRC